MPGKITDLPPIADEDVSDALLFEIVDPADTTDGEQGTSKRITRAQILALVTNGWSPILAIVTDGERRVQQIADWTGGTGTKPDTGDYIGPAGLVSDIGDAVDIRGADGQDGEDGTNGTNGTNGTDGTDGSDGTNGWTPILAIVTDGERRVQQIADWTGGTGTKPDTGDYIGPAGLVSDIGDAVDIRGAAGQDGVDGTDGTNGTNGTNGSNGAPGGESQLYTYSTTTTDSDPGSGVIRFNHATLASATQAFVDLLNSSGSDLTAWLDSLDDSTSTTKAVLRFARADSAGANFALFFLTAVTSASGYRKLALTYIGGAGTLDTTTGNTLLAVSRVGDAGSGGGGGGGFPECFHVHKGGTDQTINFTANTAVQITFPVEDYDTDGRWASDALTIHSSERWSIEGTISMPNINSGLGHAVLIYKDGSFYRELCRQGPWTNGNITLSFTAQLTEAGSYTIYVVVEASATRAIRGAATFTCLSGERTA